MPALLHMFPALRKNHTVPCAEVKARWKESEVAIQRNFQSFLIVGCQSVLREPCWNAREHVYSGITMTVLPLYLKMPLENSNVQWYCHHCQ